MESFLLPGLLLLVVRFVVSDGCVEDNPFGCQANPAICGNEMLAVQICPVTCNRCPTATQCLSCSPMPSTVPCVTTTACPTGQECYAKYVLKPNGTLLYEFGCHSSQTCPGRMSTNIVIGKRATIDHELCYKCCQGDMCNQGTLCTATPTPTNPCSPSPCVRGSCFIGSGNTPTYFCVCPSGFTGLHCETATMGTTTTPQPSTTTRTTLTTLTTIMTSQHAGSPVQTSSGVGTTHRPLDRCEWNGSHYWLEVKDYAYCLSDHPVSCCEAKRLCQTNNGNIYSNVVTKENFVDIANKMGLSYLQGTLYVWANLTENTCNPDQPTQCNISIFSYTPTIHRVEFTKVNGSQTSTLKYRVLCEKQISHSTISFPTFSSALNTLSLSQTQSTPGATIKISF